MEIEKDICSEECTCGCQDGKECNCEEVECTCGCKEENCNCDENCECGCKEEKCDCECEK